MQCKQIIAVGSDLSLPNTAAHDAGHHVLHARLYVVAGMAVFQLASFEGQAQHDRFDTSQWMLEQLATAVAEPTVVKASESWTSAPSYIGSRTPSPSPVYYTQERKW